MGLAAMTFRYNPSKHFPSSTAMQEGLGLFEGGALDGYDG